MELMLPAMPFGRNPALDALILAHVLRDRGLLYGLFADDTRAFSSSSEANAAAIKNRIEV